MATNIKSVPEAYDPCFLLPVLSDLVKSGKFKKSQGQTTRVINLRKFIMENIKHVFIYLGKVGVKFNWFDA